MASNEPKPIHKIQEDEHDEDSQSKKVLTYGWDAENLTARRVAVDSDGKVLLSSLVPEEYDYIALTYVSGGNGDGEIETAVYKTGGASGTVVATLTLAYNGDDKLSSVTRT